MIIASYKFSKISFTSCYKKNLDASIWVKAFIIALIISFYQTSPFNVNIRLNKSTSQFFKITFENGSPDESSALIIPIWTIIPTIKDSIV